MNIKYIKIYETGLEKPLYSDVVDNLPSCFSIELKFDSGIIQNINKLFCQKRNDDSLSKLMSNMKYDGDSYLLTVKYVCTEKGVFYGSPEYNIYSLDQDLINGLLMKDFNVVELAGNTFKNFEILERASKKYEILPFNDRFYIKSVDLPTSVSVTFEDPGFFASLTRFLFPGIRDCYFAANIEVKNKELKKILFL